MVGDSQMKSVRVSDVERALGGRLQCGSLQPSGRRTNQRRPPAGRPNRAYNSCPNWPGALYKESNFWDVVPKLLSTSTFTNLVLLSPTSDLTNLLTIPEGSHEALAEQSATNMFYTMVKAIKTNPSLEKVLIFEMFPRADSSHLSALAQTYNNMLRELVATSPLIQAKRITVVGHPSLAPSLTTNSGHRQQAMFGLPGSKGTDGIHYRGAEGSKYLTNSIVEGIKSAGASTAPGAAQPAGWSTQPRRGAAIIPATIPATPASQATTNNRFTVLNC